MVWYDIFIQFFKLLIRTFIIRMISSLGGVHTFTKDVCLNIDIWILWMPWIWMSNNMDMAV